MAQLLFSVGTRQRITRDEARRIAANIAKLPGLLTVPIAKGSVSVTARIAVPVDARNRIFSLCSLGPCGRYSPTSSTSASESTTGGGAVFAAGIGSELSKLAETIRSSAGDASSSLKASRDHAVAI
jgi:hypothetical protein